MSERGSRADFFCESMRHGGSTHATSQADLRLPPSSGQTCCCLFVLCHAIAWAPR